MQVQAQAPRFTAIVSPGGERLAAARLGLLSGEPVEDCRKAEQRCRRGGPCSWSDGHL